MAERDDRSRSMREVVEELVYAAIGSVAVTHERVEEVLDDLVQRGKITRDEAREVVEETSGRWRSDAGRLGERAGSSLSGVFRELGLVTRREYEELELRLAQLEHRLRLVERPTTVAVPQVEPPAPPPGMPTPTFEPGAPEPG